MDSIDRKILWELDTNCRISYEKLGQKLNLSANATRKRLENLIEDGVIVRFMVIPHNAVLDAEFISILVYTDGTEIQDDLIQRIGNHPVVHHVSPLVTTEGGTYHLFGHSHGGMNNIAEKHGKCMDVGVDTNDFYPYSLEEIEVIMKSRPKNFNEK